jgi:putative aldouronate transport system permease protein
VCVQLITEVQPKKLQKNSGSKFRRIIKDYELYLFLLPAVVWYIIFMYGPLYGLQIAFKNFNGALGIWGSKWVGFRHFKNFYNSYLFWTLIKNTLALSVYSLLAGYKMISYI